MITPSPKLKVDCSDWSDTRLVDSLGGEARIFAFEEIVRRYSRLVMGVCQRELCDRHEAEDAYQATFLVLWHRYGRVTKGEALSSWLFAVAWRISRRVAFRGRRRSKLADELQRNDFESVPSPLEVIETRYELQVLHEELASLPMRYREVLVGSYLRGLTNAQIAEELGVSMGVLAGRVRQAKAQLRRRLLQRGLGIGMVLAALESQNIANAADATSLTIPSVVLDKTTNVSDPIQSLASREIHSMTTFWSSKTLLMTTVITVPIALGLIGLQVNAGGGTSPAIMETVFAGQFSPSAVEKKSTAAFEATPSPKTEDQIRATLKELASFDFDNVPLDEAIAAISSKYGISIALDEKSIKEASIDPRQPVSLGISRVSLQKALGILLAASNLNITLQGDGLLVIPLESQKKPEAEPSFHVVRPSSKEAEIREKLSKTVSVNFQKTTLNEAVDFLAQQNKVTFIVENQAFSNAGIDDMVPVDLVVSDVRLEFCLKMMLEPLGATYLVEDDVIKITTIEAADEKSFIRVYDISRLKYKTEPEVQKLVEAIKTTGNEFSWDSVGGIGQISILPNCLVIKNTYRTHKEIEELLETIQQVPSEGFQLTPPSGPFY